MEELADISTTPHPPDKARWLEETEPVAFSRDFCDFKSAGICPQNRESKPARSPEKSPQEENCGNEPAVQSHGTNHTMHHTSYHEATPTYEC